MRTMKVLCSQACGTTGLRSARDDRRNGVILSEALYCSQINARQKILCYASLRHDFAQDDIGSFAVILSGDANASQSKDLLNSN